MVNPILPTSFLNSFTISALLHLTESERVLAVSIRIFGGAAGAALLALSAPAFGASTPSAPVAVSAVADPSVAAFYAQRRGALLWLADGPDKPAMRELLQVLHRSSLDGFASGPLIAAQAEGMIARAAGDPAALAVADRLLSSAWVRYVALLKRPPRFDRLREVGVYIAAVSFTATFLSSFLDAAFVTLIDPAGHVYWSLWRTRFLANVMTSLVLGPAILTWSHGTIEAFRKATTRQW